MQIQRAERKQARARIALTGPSGAGKTYSALLLAKGMVEYMLEIGMAHGNIQGKVGLIDTEKKSGSLYAHLFPYDVIDLDPPYTAERYMQAIKAFEDAGYLVIIIDSASHAWIGKGGVLDQVAKDQQNTANKFGVWRDVAQVEEDFWETILKSRAHIIATMRVKSEYVLTEQVDRSGRTKLVPKKVGLKPRQREGFDYEFTTVFDVEVRTHIASVSKDRTSMFDQKPTVLSDESGKRIAHWLLSGADSTMLPPEATPLERMLAAAGAAERAIDRAKNLPDLAAVFQRDIAIVKAIAPDLDEAGKEQLKEQINHLIRVKDLRKAKLAPDASTPAVDAMGPDDALALETLALDVLGTTDTVLAHFGVKRFSHMAASRVQEVKDWILAEAADDQPDGGIADMPDDIPWEEGAQP